MPAKLTKQPWSLKDVETLINLWGNKQKICAIAARLGRREEVVRAKVSHLRRIRPELKKKLAYRLDRHKLTEKDVRAIRKDKRGLKEIGADYLVSAVTIYKIKERQTWKHA